MAVIINAKVCIEDERKPGPGDGSGRGSGLIGALTSVLFGHYGIGTRSMGVKAFEPAAKTKVQAAPKRRSRLASPRTPGYVKRHPAVGRGRGDLVNIDLVVV